MTVSILGILALVGVVGSWIRENFGMRNAKPETLLKEALFAVYEDRKPPDPDLSNKGWRICCSRRTRKGNLQELERMMALSCVLPTVQSGTSQQLQEVLRAYVSKGVLQTNGLPKNVRDRVTAHLADLPASTLVHASNTKLACMDTGCSAPSTHDKSDFIEGTLEEFAKQGDLGGISGSLKIVSKGVVRYEMVASDGTVCPVEREAYYVFKLPMVLLPPQSIFFSEDLGVCEVSGGQMKLKFQLGSKTKIVECEQDKASNLPMLRVFHNASSAAEEIVKAHNSCITEEENQNLSGVKKEFFQWHFRTGHISQEWFIGWKREDCWGNKPSRGFSTLTRQICNVWDMPVCKADYEANTCNQKTA